MKNTPPLERFQSDHLFLLIGANPLPNWVAARLLLRNDGQAYLVHSRESIEVSRRLAKKLLSQGYRQPEYIPVMGASDAAEIYKAVGDRVSKIRSGQIGLNYTGGTKVMAVQAYRATERELAVGMPRPVFSYLDARTLELRIDGLKQANLVGLDPRAALTLTELMDLHDDYTIGGPNREPTAWPVVEALEILHRSESDYKAWRSWITSLQRSASSLPYTTLEWPGAAAMIAETLAQGRPLTTTLGQLCKERVWPYSRISTPERLISWLEGEWIESYVLGILKAGQGRYQLSDLGQDLRIDKGAFHFQADVAAIRGYQLHFFTCWAGNNKLTAKSKLFEAFTRARQIGGDEAGAALVCMSEEPEAVEDEVAQVMQAKGRVQVFGRRELEKLDQHLGDWFKTNIPPEEQR